MARRRTPTGLSGILALDKPEGMTSHDVVDAVRRKTRERRVGHAGTLDPLATGLLLVCVGPATRLSDYLMTGAKVYEARICFGRETTTDDREGETLRVSELPPELVDSAFATQVLSAMTGPLEQLPPAFSAIKKDGVTAYKAARAGMQLELEPRQVELFDAFLLATGKDFWEVRLSVSKGYYVRSFARDLGRKLNSAAFLGTLRRTASGSVTIEQAITLPLSNLSFIDPVAALGYPLVEVSTTEAQDVAHGRPLMLSVLQSPNNLISIVHEDHFLALYKTVGKSSLAQPKVVIPGGIPRV